MLPASTSRPLKSIRESAREHNRRAHVVVIDIVGDIGEAAPETNSGGLMADGVNTDEGIFPSTMVAHIGDMVGGPIIFECGGHTVQHNHVMPGFNCHVHNMRSDEARAAGYKNSHDGILTVAIFTGFSHHSRRTVPRLTPAGLGFPRRSEYWT